MTTILIVEDEAIVAADLAGKLGRLGYEVCGIAAEGEEAVAMAWRLRPHLVVMDIRLEGTMDGIEAAEAIRSRHDVPVIYLTAHSDAATLSRAKLTGPFGYILKPFEERELATQIELALYKHKADLEIRRQREWLRVTLTSIGDAVIATDAAGCITFVNPVAESLTGWKSEEAAGKPVPRVFCVVDEHTGQPLEEPVARVLREGRAVALANHAALVTRDGRTVPVEDTAAPIMDEAGQVIGAVLVFHDVTEKRKTERERETTVEFLHLVNQSPGKTDMVRAAVTFFQKESGCEAVGIRLKKGDDYPYFEARGFPQAFVETENALCARDSAGNIIRDSVGDPFIECMCGNVICGRVDPSKPFFSPAGSFWTNSTTKLLAATGDADRQTRTCNRCNGEGYESVALIPLRLGPERLGLLQFNDRRTGMFSSEVIALWERLGGYLAVALAKSLSDEKIQRQNEILETMNQIFYKALTCETEEALGVACLTAVEALTQSKFGFIGEIGPDGLLHEIAISDPGWELCTMYDKSGHRRPPGDFNLHGLYGRVLRDGKSLLVNDPDSHPDSIGTPQGHPPLTAFLGVPLVQDGKTIGMVSLANRDGGYTQEHLHAVEAIAPAMVQALLRKRAEEALSKSHGELELRVRDRTAELERSNQALQEFASIASHDMLEPLRKVKAFGCRLSDKYGSSLGDQGKDYLGRMLSATERMQSLLDSLLKYSRVTTKAEPFVEIDLSELVQEVLTDLEARIDQSGGQVEIGDLPTIQADASQMRQLFQNLIGNALKYHGELNPVVRIYGEALSPICRIYVEDNGIGFEDMYLDQIFAPFQRLHGRSSRYEGAGMGLAICKKIVERHGGSITARSKPGVGSTFIMTFPIKQNADRL